MYRVLFLLILLAISVPVFASRTVVTQTPYHSSYYAPQAYYGGDYIPNRRFQQRRNKSIFSDINELERYALNKIFIKDSDQVRLERLETLAYGAVQSGDIYTRYDNVRNSILSRPKPNYKTSVFKNISDYFNGQITGFTPSIIQNAFYSQPYGMNYGIDSGSTVRILD